MMFYSGKNNMRKKYNLIGSTFSHLTGGNKGYSVHGKESKYIKWVNNPELDTFYVDGFISQAFNNNDIRVKKYGWLLESNYIIPGIVNDVKNRYKEYLQVFDLIFTHDHELLSLDDKFKWVPAQGSWIKNLKVYDKSKLISMISSNKSDTEGHRVRLNWVNKLKNNIDLYGRGFNYITDKEEGLCDYMFSVVIENGFYKSYFTEKILDCFATGTIPIYLGTPDIGTFFNPSGIITLTDDFNLLNISKDLYYEKIGVIKENLENAKKFEIIEDYIFLNYL
jgi:hypothetical protein